MTANNDSLIEKIQAERAAITSRDDLASTDTVKASLATLEGCIDIIRSHQAEVVALKDCLAAYRKELLMQNLDNRDNKDTSMIDLETERVKAVLDAAGVDYVN